MVEIIQRRQDPSVKIGQQLGGIVESGFKGYNEGQRLKQDAEERSRIGKELGITLSKNPELAKVQLSEALKSKRQREKLDFLSQWGMGEETQEPSFSERMNEPQDYDEQVYQNLSNEEIQNPYQQEEIPNTQKNKKKIPSQKDVLNLTALDPALGRAAGEIRKEGIKGEQFLSKEQKDQQRHDQEIFTKNREFYYKHTKDAIKEADKIIENAPKVENDLRNLKRSILSKDLSGYQAYLIDKLGWEPAKTENMALFANATKDLLVESLADIPGGRPNQFLERFLSQGLPAMGRPEVSNMALYETKKFNEDMKLERAKIKRRLYDEDVENENYSNPGSLNSRTDKELAQYAADRQEKISYDLQNLVEQKMSDAEIIDKILKKDFIPDTPLTPRTSTIINNMVNGDVEPENMTEEQVIKYIQKCQELGLVPNKYGAVE